MLGAPGPTAMTVASGRGLFVDDEGRKMSLAVFWHHVHSAWLTTAIGDEGAYR